MKKLRTGLLALMMLGGSLGVYAAVCQDGGGNKFCGETCSSSGETCSCTGDCSKAELEAVLE